MCWETQNIIAPEAEEFIRNVSRLPRDVAKIKSWGGGLKPITSAEREPITGIWGPSRHRGPEAEPLVRESGGEAPKPENFFPSSPTGEAKFISSKYVANCA